MSSLCIILVSTRTPPFTDTSPAAPRRETKSNKNKESSSSRGGSNNNNKEASSAPKASTGPAPSLSELKRMFQDMCDEMDQDVDEKWKLKECRTVAALVATWPNKDKCWALVKDELRGTNSDTAKRLKDEGHEDLSLFLAAKIKEKRDRICAKFIREEMAHAAFIESNWDFEKEDKLKSYTDTWMLLSFDDIIDHVKDSRISRVLRQWKQEKIRGIEARRATALARVARDIEGAYPNQKLMKGHLNELCRFERKDCLTLLRGEVRVALLNAPMQQPEAKTPDEKTCSIM